jgi:allophanate hydrolase subunit 1
MDQTVIYPLDSPGGWNLIGLMPIPLFDARRHEPVLLKAGEHISFKPIQASEYKELQEACRDGQLPIAQSEGS